MSGVKIEVQPTERAAVTQVRWRSPWLRCSSG